MMTIILCLSKIAYLLYVCWSYGDGMMLKIYGGCNLFFQGGLERSRRRSCLPVKEAHPCQGRGWGSNSHHHWLQVRLSRNVDFHFGKCKCDKCKKYIYVREKTWGVTWWKSVKIKSGPIILIFMTSNITLSSGRMMLGSTIACWQEKNPQFPPLAGGKFFLAVALV